MIENSLLRLFVLQLKYEPASYISGIFFRFAGIVGKFGWVRHFGTDSSEDWHTVRSELLIGFNNFNEKDI